MSAGSNATGEPLLELVRVMRRLRDPGGCPWDREQTHASLRRHLLEEAHEVLEAIDAGDDDRLREELGDLLIQVVFHAQIAEDEGAFTVDDVATKLVEKLVRRHPHVFGDARADTPDAVLANWDRIKADEKGGLEEHLEDDIPPSLPALLRAYKVQRRARARGFDWRSREGALGKLREELGELAGAEGAEEVEAELGDLLFAAVAVARLSGVDAESALRGATRRFAERFEQMLRRADEAGADLAGMSEAELLAFFRRSREGAG
ncbi:MAG TPA: nucleoside triphosphate pyrophosphohydrolase [Actinomycetota bacterium]|nr:nucleoside triphosphate pyrophosphohydrolase [Actinomycetota bacterium]